MPIASMLEADKPFMFATSSTGRPATAPDLVAPSNSSKSTTSAAATTSNDGVPTFARSSSYQPPPPPPPQCYTPPPSTTGGPPSSSYYHPHEQQQHRNHTHSHQHHHHSAPAIQDDDHFLYHHPHHPHHPHPHHAPPPPVSFGRPPPAMEQENSFAYRSSNTAGTHIASMYSQRRMPQQQQQQQQQQQPHLHHHSSQYHVHHHIHRPPLPPQSVMDEHYRVSTSAAAAAQAGAGAAAAAVPPPPAPAVLPPTTTTASSSVAQAQSAHPPTSSSTTTATATSALGVYDAEDSDTWLLEGNYEADSRRQKKKKDFGGRLEKINTDFMENKERIYAEKLSAIQQEIKQVHENTHVALLEGIEELKRTREKRIYDGRLLLAYREQVIDNQFNQERMHAEDECLAEKQEMREKLFAALEDKRRKLKEDKDNCELAYDTLLESQSRMMKRNLRRRGMEHSDNKSVKRKQTSGPSLVFRLKDDDLQSDLDAMHIDCVPLLNKKLTSANKKK